MNDTFLGDALDHWKGSLVRILNDKQTLCDLAVEPMLTKQWPDGNLEIYRKLLNLQQQNKIYHANSTFPNRKKERQQYFQDIQHHNGDIFLDPDIGIYTGERPKKEYITISDIAQILTNGESHNRVLMIYQHLAREPVNNHRWRIQNKIGQLNLQAPYCVYQCGQAAMIFVSLNKQRIDAIQEALISYLRGSTAEMRIWS